METMKYFKLCLKLFHAFSNMEILSRIYFFAGLCTADFLPVGILEDNIIYFVFVHLKYLVLLCMNE